MSPPNTSLQADSASVARAPSFPPLNSISLGRMRARLVFIVAASLGVSCSTAPHLAAP